MNKDGKSILVWALMDRHDSGRGNPHPAPLSEKPEQTQVAEESRHSRKEKATKMNDYFHRHLLPPCGKSSQCPGLI